MALKQLLLTREKEEKKRRLETLRAEAEALNGRRAACREREQRAEEALNEMNEETPAEVKEQFDQEVEEILEELDRIDEAESENSEEIEELNARIEEISAELEQLEEKTDAAQSRASGNTKQAERKEKSKMGRNVITGMDRRERIRAAMEGEGAKAFVKNVRTMMQRGGITNASFLVPTEFLPILRENITRYSALMQYVNVQRLNGDGKQTVLGAVPEAVWTEQTGKINEMDLTAAQLLIGGNKVAGYIAVPNAYLEDSEENLAEIVLDYVGQSIGFAIDKAILYGNGSNMPVGIMARLGATSKPSWWQDNAGDFVNLSTTHTGKASSADVSGTDLFQEMLSVLGQVKAKYGTANGKFWAMSAPTWSKLQIELMATNAAGAIVTGADMKMPIIGGDVVLLDNIVEDGVVIGGYGSQYLLAERAPMELASSEHAMFIEDNTVFRGKARYDGLPIAGEGFAAFSMSTTAAATSKTFAEDKANSVD